MSTNLYSHGQPVMISSGVFWRCRHGHTFYDPCGLCGFFHPVRFLTHAWKRKI